MTQYIPKDTIIAVRKRSGDRCELCSRNRWLQMAHVEAKGMGGRHNEAETENSAPSNILHLCEICHMAVSHGVKVVRDGESCDTCYKRGSCVESALALGIPEPKVLPCESEPSTSSSGPPSALSLAMSCVPNSSRLPFRRR